MAFEAKQMEECMYACSVTQLCLTLCNPMDCSPPGSSVHGILQVRILEWVAISFHLTVVLEELIVLMLVWIAKLILLHRSQPKCPISICLADFLLICACVRTKLLHLCPTLCDPMDGSPPGSSVHGILQVKILECIAIPFSRGSSQPRDQILVSALTGGFFTDESPGNH